MTLSTTIYDGQPNHAGLHNEERTAINALQTPPLGSPNNPVTTAGATRPTGLTIVWWVCATQPTNWISGDIWINNS